MEDNQQPREGQEVNDQPTLEVDLSEGDLRIALVVTGPDGSVTKKPVGVAGFLAFFGL